MQITQEFTTNPHVYLVINTITGKMYVGQSNGKSSSYFCGGTYIKNSIRKYGRKCFCRKILIEGNLTQEELDKWEAHYIKEYNTLLPNGYNLSQDGKGLFISNGIAWNKGKTGIYTSQQLEVMRQYKLGIPLSEEHRNKISESNKGKVTSEETKLKLAARAKPVLQYSLEGEFIKEWNSVKEASQTLNILVSDINSCCIGKYKSASGYVWRRKLSNEIPQKIDCDTSITTNQVVQMDMDSNIIKVWTNAKECASELGYYVINLRNACKKEITYKGFKWKYILNRGANKEIIT